MMKLFVITFKHAGPGEASIFLSSSILLKTAIMAIALNIQYIYISSKK